MEFRAHCAEAEREVAGLRCGVVRFATPSETALVVAGSLPRPVAAWLAAHGAELEAGSTSVLAALAARLGFRLLLAPRDAASATAAVGLLGARGRAAAARVALRRLAALTDLAARLSAASAEQARRSRLDELTGLPGRREFQEAVQQALRRCNPRRDVLAVLLLDIDRFKTVNETLGTVAGDFLLRTIARRLEQSPGIEALARYGEDSFALLLVGCSNQDDVRRHAAAILRAASDRHDLGGADLFSTASVGVSLYPWDGEEANALLRNAEIAMYTAKQRGRNRVELYSPVTGVHDFAQLELKTGLSRVLERGELEVLYQLKVAADSGETRGVEALLRWRHPTMGRIPPARFIPLAEETGLILAIGEWVLDNACRQTVIWHDLGFTRVRLAVNVSGVQFRESDFVDKVARVLDRTFLRPTDLELEITESVAMDDVAATRARLREIEAMGVRVAIDDFGTGYSSLAYLKTLPIHTLKIDKSFVSNLATHDRDAAIVRTVIALASNLGLEVVAEGVERAEHASFLREHGCDLLQGYLYGEPMPAEAVTRILRQWRDARATAPPAAMPGVPPGPLGKHRPAS